MNTVNTITYHREGDYLLPDLIPPASPRIGVWGIRCREHLRKHHDGLYTGLLLSGKLNAHLEEIDRSASEMFDLLIQQYAEREGVTEELKALDQIEWVRKMNTLDPWVVRWEQSLSRALFTPDEKKRYFFKFNVEGLLRGDYQSRMNGYATARQNGWMSANDIRELENLDRIPAEDGGDLYLINGNMLPLIHAGAFADINTSPGKEETEPDEQSEEVLELEKSGGRQSRGTKSS